jgi:DNA-binding response OmpR family regulator
MSSQATPNVVVITSSVTAAFLVRRRLEPAGFQCVQVQDVLEAQQQLVWLTTTGQTVQAVIALDPADDYDPQRLRDLVPQARMLVLMQESRPSDFWRLLQVHADVVAVEPVTPEELQQSVQHGSFDSLSH